MNDTGDAPFRWIATAVLLSSIALSTYYRRKARAGGDVIERKREGGAMMIGRALIALPLFGSALAYLANPPLACLVRDRRSGLGSLGRGRDRNCQRPDDPLGAQDDRAQHIRDRVHQGVA